MRFWLVVWLAVSAGCPPPTPTYYPTRNVPAPGPRGPGKLDHRTVDFVFEGGQLELELYRRGTRIVQTVRTATRHP
ncbi:MAG: hypothetical protein WKG01_42745 [Kofleriaceae bacterium]